METASVREASARVIAALGAAGRSRTTIKRHEAELNAFARFLQDRSQGLPQADCLDFVAERSGSGRPAGLRQRASSRQAQLAGSLVLLMECLDGGMPRWARPPRRWPTGGRRVSARPGMSTSRRACGAATPKPAS